MAVPTAQQSGMSRLAAWARKFGAAIGRPLFAVILAMIAGAIVIMITWSNPQVDRFTGAVNAYSALYSGSFGSLLSLSYTLVGVTPLILAGLSSVDFAGNQDRREEKNGERAEDADQSQPSDRLFAPQPGEALLRHAVRAPEVAPVGHRDAQVAHRAAERVDERGHRRQR